MNPSNGTPHHQNGHSASANGRSMPSVEPQFREGRENQDVFYVWKFFPELLNEGHRLAVTSCRRSRNPEDEASLTARAEAVANSFISDGRYDPVNNLADKIREEKYQKNRTVLASLEDQEPVEVALVLDHERNGASATKPAISLAVKIPAVMGLVLIVALTLHDCVFFNLSDAVIAWLFSILFSLPLAMYITFATLDESGASVQSDKSNKGFLSGILIGAGLCLLRLSSVGLQAEALVFTLALTVFEMAIVIGLWGIGNSHRKEMARWLPYAADKARLEDTREKIKELIAAIDEHIDYVRGRNRLCDLYDQGKLKEVLNKLLLSKYHDGIGENVSWIKGVGPKPELKEEIQWKPNGKSH